MRLLYYGWYSRILDVLIVLEKQFDNRRAGRQLPAFPDNKGKFSMEVYLQLGGVLFAIQSERELDIDVELSAFIQEKTENYDLIVSITWDWDNAPKPEGEMIGQDLIQNYYIEGDRRFCETRGGWKGAIACASYTADFSHVLCAVNEKPFLQPPKMLGSLLRMLPMREIFLHFGTLFLHASQIAYNGRGILFAAPSGTGKTTQARLWQEFCGAEIICNDRTLLRKHGGVWHTYGYPLDGSEPVRSGAVNRLGCVVLLEQGKENRVQRLSPGKAVGPLMRQAVMDCWSAEAREGVMNLLFSLLEDVPVFLLSCTPDQHAVEVLKGKLEEEEVIVNG